MKLHYYNMSNEPTIIYTWAILKDTIDEDDIAFLDGLKIKVRVDAPTHTFDTVGGRTKTVYGKPLITATTTTDKQRSMFQLKYSGQSTLIERSVLLPHSSSFTIV